MDVAGLIVRHGPLLVGAVCFIESIGLPVPAAVALLGAGALSHQGSIITTRAFAAGLCGLLAGDAILFALGRYTGWYFLGLLCRLSANPESCIYNSAHRFYRQGRTALLFTKFVPGINTMAAPLAGSLSMKPTQFFALDLAGALIYAGVYFGLGWAFSGFLGSMVDRMESTGRVMQTVLLSAFIAFLIYRAFLAWRLRAAFFDIPRISVAEAAQALADGAGQILVMDVRSHGYYGAAAVRIQGAARLEPNRLAEAMHELPEDKKIYLYCT